MAYLVSVIALGIAATLTVAGAQHVRHRSALREILGRHDLVPKLGRGAVAAALGPMELVLGIGVGAGLFVSPAERYLSPALVASGTLFLIFGAYVAALVLRGSDAPCGCDAGDRPVGSLTVARAGVLGAAALVAAAGSPTLTLSLTIEGALVTLAAMSMATLVWILPESLEESRFEAFIRERLA